ncbi:MAG: nuclear transport factor 2 family protein [Ignavibacteria bacterium]|nr:nuclear transport factor 2 family protein [Ignavibacteria bacterium]MBT8381113.1 nuclear transport factor 2 family protein [Ignavibacteria bacterium]MBT8392149.1 nuclear transport factor 2 family protein [Ignavibacteria bacterium]NNJ53549.1 SnoaL-like domain-containing protein [Ignavibacteriaceae bacterium]NNL21421.1 SnoaL-like domain-containing protein [Ignavibacteriaceae bacterium]
MKNLIISFSVLCLFLSYSANTFAGDKEDVLALVSKNIDSFNKQDYKTYISNFVDDNTEFPYVVSPLRHDATMWKNFIEGTASLAYVNYHQQDEQVQLYNGNTAVVTAYFKFTWMEKGGMMNYQTGRASMVLVKQSGKWMVAHMHFSKMFD